MTIKGIYKAANEVLQNYGKRELPISIESIAQALGVQVIAFPMESDASGILVIEPGKATIGYNQEESWQRRRFTLAHELGHFVLHNPQNESKVFVDNQFKVDNITVLYRSKESNDDPVKARLEFEANTFAAALLMPEELIMEEIEKIEFDLGDGEAINQLSQRFGVSSTAMYYRLLNLRKL